MRKLTTILFTILLVFTTQTVYAADRESASGLTIPVEFIAIPLIIILLIVFGLLAKHYSRFRDQIGKDSYIEPASPQTATIIAPMVAKEPVQEQIKAKPEQESGASDRNDVSIIRSETPAKPKEEPLPKEYKILQVFAYILIVAGIVIRFISSRKSKSK